MSKVIFLAIALLLAGVQGSNASQARVSRIVKDVKILRAPNASHSAALNESVPDGASIQTGVGSQTELRFDDGTLVRLGGNSFLRLNDGARKIELVRGAILARVPKNSGEARIVIGNVVSAIQGTTSLLEFYPQAYTKLIVLDGTARLFMPQVIGESVLVEAGQLIMFQAKVARNSLPNPVDIDLRRMMATSLLIRGFPPLGSESSIAQGMRNQKKKKSDGALTDTNLVIYGRGTLVSLIPPEASPSPSPSPKPSAR